MVSQDKWKLSVKISIVMCLGLLFLVLAGSTWDYSNSSQFCASCHTMEFVTSSYATSPHAEVSCTSCHLGVGFSPVMLFKKATEVNQVVKNVTGTYEKPIRIRNQVPVEKSCESCHYTDVFYNQRLKVVNTYNQDEENTKMTQGMLLNVGGGTEAKGIHWHVENRVIFGKDEAGNISYVEVETPKGEIGTYLNTELPDAISFKQMDCVDCHNRVAHRIYEPSKAVDQYLLDNRIDTSLPYAKREIVLILESLIEQPEELWEDKFNQIVDFYRQNYPHVYNERKEDIDALPNLLQDIAREVLFPSMEVTWETYNDNLNHDGCFQCHNTNFKLQENSVPASSLPETVRVDCTLCHSMPVSSGEEGKALTIQFK
ncbi:MAG: NapC/NirT family cytochrome c [Bacillota bacterium]|nr:NapC/NirT family cytochrome c [Bacillota bacterium]